MEIILASASLQRKELLKKIVKEFEVIPAHIDENISFNKKEPSEIAEFLALKKAEKISDEYPEALVIGADTVVELEGVLYGKPKNDAEAIMFLKKFRGTVQQVITGIAVLCKEKNIRLIDSETTYVKMRNDIADEEIESYVESGEGKDKAGSYAVQEKGDKFVEWLKGDYYNVVGLPLEELSKMLKEAKDNWDLKIDLV
jgi:septum formation protein